MRTAVQCNETRTIYDVPLLRHRLYYGRNTVHLIDYARISTYRKLTQAHGLLTGDIMSLLFQPLQEFN